MLMTSLMTSINLCSPRVSMVITTLCRIIIELTESVSGDFSRLLSPLLRGTIFVSSFLFHYVSQWITHPACGSLVWVHPVRCVSSFSLQMGQINPSVRLYVVTVDGSSITTELRPPDSLEKRFPRTGQTPSGSLRDRTLTASTLFFACFPAATSTSPWWSGRPPRSWASAGSTGLRTRPSFHFVTSRRAPAKRSEGAGLTGCFAPFQELGNSLRCLFVFFPRNFQKHVMTSDKWLDRLVSDLQGFHQWQ